MGKLSQEEKGILDAYESGQLRRAKDAQRSLQQHQEYAEASLRKYVEARLHESGGNES